MFVYPDIKWGTGFVTSTAGHQFKCKPRAGVVDLGVGLDGFCATGSVRLVPSAHKGNGFGMEGKEETFYGSFCTSSCRSVNWVMWGSCWSRWLLGNGGAPHHWWSLTLPSCCLLTKHSPSWHRSQKASGPWGWEVQGPPALFLCWQWWWRVHLFTNVTPKVTSGRWGEGQVPGRIWGDNPTCPPTPASQEFVFQKQCLSLSLCVFSF